jgi:DNA-binding CsgD family transcriptional regulator
MTASVFHVVYIASDLASRSHRLTTPLAVLPGPDDRLVVYRNGASGWSVAGGVDQVRWAGDLALVQVRDALYLMHADTLPRPSVTAHERAILHGLAAGWTHRDLARQIHLAEGTIHQYISRLHVRLGAKHRAHLIAIAKDQGLI